MHTRDREEQCVCVVGVGAATAVGATAASSAAAVRAGISAFAEHPTCRDALGEPVIVARAAYLDIAGGGAERLLNLGRIAAREALSALPPRYEADWVPGAVGLPEERPGLAGNLEELPGRLGDAVPGRGRLNAGAFRQGHASGLMAVEAGLRCLRANGAEFFLAGGIDSYLHPDTLSWVEACGQLHTTVNAWGFIPGEAAAFCLLCSGYTASRYGLRVLGRVEAVATALEENPIKTDTVCVGSGLTRAMRGVLAAVSPADARIDQTICDLNGEAYRADEFGFALARTSERFVDPSRYLAPADCWGDVGAASGPLFVILAAAAAAKGYARGPRALLWASSEGGTRCATLFHAEVGGH